MIKFNGRNYWATGSLRFVVGLTLFGFQGLLTSGISAQSSEDAKLVAAGATLNSELGQLASKCLEQRMPDQAALASSWIPDRERARQYIFIPPSFSDEVAADSSELHKSFHGQLTKVKSNYAEQLYQIAVANAGIESTGPWIYQLLHEALTYDPEHEKARLALGFRKHHELGWVRSAKPTRSKKARARQKIIGWDAGAYWQILSPHFEIYSAAGEAEGLKLAEELERTYWVWRQVFFDYWCNDSHLKGWLEGTGSDRSPKRQFKVILFRDRQQYLTDLADVPNIEVSSGYYDEKKRASLFYAGDDPPIGTWRHETIHQLLQENAAGNKSVADKGHAWLVEGVAMYFESMQVHDHFITLGGFDSERLQYARLRCKREGFYKVMQELDEYGRAELQNHPDIRALYSQSAGISQFLFSAENGRYRNGFVKFVKEFYKERRVRSSLAELTLALDQLDRHYKEYLIVTADDLKSPLFSSNASQLSALALGRAGLKNEDVAALKLCTQLDWLELSENRLLDDGAIDALSEMDQITQLFLDVTRVTDACAPKLAELTTLQEIDLASTQFSDAGVAVLTTLPDLKVLWLAGSQVSDACIDDLLEMPKLNLVDLRQTKVTRSGLQRLESARPDMKIMK